MIEIHFKPVNIHVDFIQKNIFLIAVRSIGKKGHETDLEMSPQPLGTTIFEEIYIRIHF